MMVFTSWIMGASGAAEPGPAAPHHNPRLLPEAQGNTSSLAALRMASTAGCTSRRSADTA